MRAIGLRSPLSVFALALVVACVFGPGRFVGAADGQNQQPTRRGKNGTPDSSTPQPVANGQAQGATAGTATTSTPVVGQSASPASATDAGSSGASSVAPTAGSSDSSVPANGTQTQQSKSQDERSGPANPSQSTPDPAEVQQAPTDSGNRAQHRPEPPPFDRPPISTKQNPPSTGRSDAQRPDDGADSNQGSYEPPSERQGGYSQPESGRGNSRPPVLERSPDLGPSRNGGANGSSGRTQPPVLQRSGDDSSNDDSAPPPQTQGERRNGSDSRQPRGQQQDETIKLDATLVNIPVVVSDRSGRFIPRLSKNDFNVTEDGVRQQVAFFGSEEVPFNVALLLDISPSVSNSARDIQDAALAFINELRPEDKVMIVAFDEHVRFLTDFTNDRREMTYAIENTRTGNGTSVYEAVYNTVANRLKYVEGRKAMILFSDGEDTTSRRVKYQDCIDLVSESDVLVYGLRYPDTGGYGPNVPFPRTRLPWPMPTPGTRMPFPFPFPWPGRGHFDSGPDPADSGANHWNGQWGRRGGGQRNYNRDFMRDITEAGGGPVYDAQTVGDMSRLARQIADELRHVYVVSYYPTNSLTNGGYRTVRVSITGRDDLAVRHRKGYYADAVSGKATT